MKILLDTHILLWWLTDSNELDIEKAKLLSDLESKGDSVFVSVMSLWEIAKLASYKRITLKGSVDVFLKNIENNPWFQIIPLSSEIILESTRLGDSFHKDPVDQLIVASARIYGLKLMTADKKIIQSKIVSVI